MARAALDAMGLPSRDDIAQKVADLIPGMTVLVGPDVIEPSPAAYAVADAILALLPGKTEREVAEAAWDEGRQSLALDMGNPLREDMTRESTANPYRAKGATNE
jgi:hypothetical protein